MLIPNPKSATRCGHQSAFAKGHCPAVENSVEFLRRNQNLHPAEIGVEISGTLLFSSA
jgi:hypothetical protein